MHAALVASIRQEQELRRMGKGARISLSIANQTKRAMENVAKEKYRKATQPPTEQELHAVREQEAAEKRASFWKA
jgi:hypothetical protein